MSDHTKEEAPKTGKLIALVGYKGSGKDAAADVLLQTGWENIKMAGALKAMIRSLLYASHIAEADIDRMIEGDLKEVVDDRLNLRRIMKVSHAQKMVYTLLVYQGMHPLIAMKAFSGTRKAPHELLMGFSPDQMVDTLMCDWFTWLQREENTPRWLMQSLGTEWGRNSIRPDIWTNITAKKITSVRNTGRSVIVTDARFPNENQMLLDLGAMIACIDRPGLITETVHESEAHIANLLCHVKLLNDGSIEAIQRKLVRFTEQTTEMYPVFAYHG